MTMTTAELSCNEKTSETLSTYTSVEELKSDVIAFGLKFKIDSKMPTKKEYDVRSRKADTVYYIPYDVLSTYARSQTASGSIGIIHFGTKTMGFGIDNNLTKLGLKGFLFRSTTCGICTGPAFIGSNGCGKCGFLICAICEMKLGLAKMVSISLPIARILCAKCRDEYHYSILPSLNHIIFDMDKFNNTEKLQLKLIVETHWEMIGRRNGSAKHLRKMHEINEEFKAKLDMSKCAKCQQVFTSKRSKCGGCKQVAYCNAECQRSHWKIHKNDCKLFKTYQRESQ